LPGFVIRSTGYVLLAGVPEGRVPFISIPSGGVPDGRVPFISIPSGGVPDGRVLFAWSPSGCVPDRVTDCSDDPVEVDACASVSCACTDDAGVDAADCVEVLPESDVQPATKIPAMRITDATNMILVLFFMENLSLDNDLPGEGIICHQDWSRPIYIHHITPVKYSAEICNN
jgi:hypothetical protein